MKVSPIHFAAVATLSISEFFDSISLAQSVDRPVISAEHPDVIAGVPVRVFDGEELKYPDHSVINRWSCASRRCRQPAPITINVEKPEGN